MHAHIALTFLSCGANPKLRALRLRARLRLHWDIRHARSDTSRSSCPLRYQQKLPLPLYGVHSLSETAKQARRAAGAHFPWPIGSEQQKDWEESAASGTSKLTANRQCFGTYSEACAAQPRVAATSYSIRNGRTQSLRSRLATSRCAARLEDISEKIDARGIWSIWSIWGIWGIWGMRRARG